MHLGHHAILGDVMKTSAAPTAHGLTFDGDVFSVNTWSLVPLTTGGRRGPAYALPCLCFWKWPALARLVADPFWHLGHFLALLVLWDGGILVFATVGAAVVVVVGPCVAVAPRRLRQTLVPASAEDPNLGAAASVAVDIGAHSLLWAASFAALVGMPRGGDPWKTVVYLCLSELFLYGFGFHPFAGYFLAVHRCDVDASPEDDLRVRDSKVRPKSLLEKQPTTSTYSALASITSANLNLHVEHHDWPTVPCHRLHKITRLFPDYYEPLRKSTGYASTILDYLRSGSGWVYSCDAVFYNNLNLDDIKHKAEVIHATVEAQHERRRGTPNGPDPATARLVLGADSRDAAAV